MKKVWIDLETTGLDPVKHGVIQIAGIIEVGDEKVEEFDYYCQPLKGDKITRRALEINNIDYKDLDKRDPPSEIMASLLEVFKKHIDPFDKKDKFTMLGYNSKFDYDFLRKWFEKQNYSYFGSFVWFPPVDIMNLAAYIVGAERASFKNFQLSTVAEQYGVKSQIDNLHNAAYDISITRSLYYKLKETRLLNGAPTKTLRQ
jgi:DNA polymerase-3 subunit epsilon